eukprot:1159116-Pelagomonas_calceolata.AAC.6
MHQHQVSFSSNSCKLASKSLKLNSLLLQRVNGQLPGKARQVSYLSLLIYGMCSAGYGQIRERPTLLMIPVFGIAHDPCIWDLLLFIQASQPRTLMQEVCLLSSQLSDLNALASGIRVLGHS